MILRNLAILVFADRAELAETGRALAEDARLAKCRVEVHSGGVLAAAEWLGSNPSPDVLLVGDPADETIWPRLERLAESVESNCRVIVVGHKDSIAIYRDLTAKGLADYLGGNIQPQDIIESLGRLFGDDTSLPKGKLVVVLPTAGGAGASTVAAVLVNALSERHGDAILLDLDLTMGTGGLILGADIRDSLAAAISNPGVDASMLERFMVREGAVRILSTPGTLRDGVVLDADAVERILTLARSMAKVVVVDMPKGWGEAYERSLTLADEVVFVATPDLPSVRNCRMMIDDVVARRVNAPRPKVILNKAGMAKANEYGPDDFKEALGLPPAAVVPWDPEPLMAAMAEGKAITSATGKAIAALRAFSETVLPTKDTKVVKEQSPTGLVARLKGLFSKKE